MGKVLTKREMEIIEKKLRGVSLTQNESNILSKYIRPKLREMQKIRPDTILKRIDYNQKALPTEKKIKKIVLWKIPKADSITICGSAIQNNYEKYNDIDLIIATKSTIKNKEKIKLTKEIEEEGKKEGLKLDVQIYSKISILKEYPHNPSLIYQLKDSKVIYGSLKVPAKISLSNLDLRMKLDWSEADSGSKSEEIYYAIRNALLVSLILNKKVDNYELKNALINLLGENLANKLKNNSASSTERKLALKYLGLMLKYLEEELKKSKWEKIEIESP
ncbi:MAG: nucleotidyltransferase domain-containing protein [Nanoarchaeota archaeon]|nr:nucleotidyltransferase domain-containing protein [Nanoarchaeota archaeon]